MACSALQLISTQRATLDPILERVREQDLATGGLDRGRQRVLPALDAAPRAVPFAKEEVGGGGLDWFQVVDEGAVDSSASQSASSQSVAPVGSSAGSLPPLASDGSLHMYWLDAYEDNINAPGSVYVFGKVAVADGKFASCCASLKGLERNVFVLPRKRALVDGEEVGDEVTFVQVYKEVQELCKKHRITRYGCKRVERQYAFEEAGMPKEAAYLKLVYSAELPALPSDLSGTYFSRVFGTGASCLELLLLKRRGSGPSHVHLHPHVTLPLCSPCHPVTQSPPP